jgi:lysophospholipase L1-like esterase
LYQIVDLYSIFVNDKGYIKEGLTTDGIHINEKGYKKWAKYIKPLIKDL